MYVRAIETRHASVVISLGKGEALRLISREDEEIDDKIYKSAVDQLNSGQAAIPKDGDYIVAIVSMAEKEVKDLINGNDDFIDRFLTVITEQVENTHNAIVRHQNDTKAGPRTNKPTNGHRHVPRKPKTALLGA